MVYLDYRDFIGFIIIYSGLAYLKRRNFTVKKFTQISWFSHKKAKKEKKNKHLAVANDRLRRTARSFTMRLLNWNWSNRSIAHRPHRRVLVCHRHRRVLRHPISHVTLHFPIITAPVSSSLKPPAGLLGGGASKFCVSSYHRSRTLWATVLEVLLCCFRHGEQLLWLKVRPLLSLAFD